MKDIKWAGKAMILGLAFFIAVLLVKPIGVSTQFSVVSGIIHSTLDSDVITENPDRASGYESTNAYYDRDEGKLAKSIKHPWGYSFIFVLAIPLGAYLGHKLMNKNQAPKQEKINKMESLDMAEESFTKKYLPGFVSGFLILYGARMAGGCTSGHMMSGIMQSSLSGFIFAAAVFLVAIPVSIFASKKNSSKGVTL